MKKLTLFLNLFALISLITLSPEHSSADDKIGEFKQKARDKLAMKLTKCEKHKYTDIKNNIKTVWQVHGVHNGKCVYTQNKTDTQNKNNREIWQCDYALNDLGNTGDPEVVKRSCRQVTLMPVFEKSNKRTASANRATSNRSANQPVRKNDTSSKSDDDPDGQDIVTKLKNCEKFTTHTPHPFIKTFSIKHTIHGFVGDKCKYTQTMPGDGLMECMYSKSQLTNAFSDSVVQQACKF